MISYDEAKWTTGGIIFGLVVGLVIGGFIAYIWTYRTGFVSAETHYQHIAIKKGYAKMVMIDSISGESKFFWMDSLPNIK